MGRTLEIIPGDDLLSHTLARAVPSALRGLTAVFGMGTGVSPSPESPENLICKERWSVVAQEARGLSGVDVILVTESGVNSDGIRWDKSAKRESNWSSRTTD